MYNVHIPALLLIRTHVLIIERPYKHAIRDCRGRDRMVVGCLTTYVINTQWRNCIYAVTPWRAHRHVTKNWEIQFKKMIFLLLLLTV
jgi:hypothetical protein